MPRLTISVKNAKLVAKNLQDLHAEIPRISEQHLEKVAKRVIKQMRDYPPQRSGQKYVRTYRLFNSWRYKRASNGFTIQGDPVHRGRHYGKYVVGNADGREQAWMHVGRWLLFRDVVEYEMTRVPKAVEDNIRAVARSKGF